MFFTNGARLIIDSSQSRRVELIVRGAAGKKLNMGLQMAIENRGSLLGKSAKRLCYQEGAEGRGYLAVAREECDGCSTHYIC